MATKIHQFDMATAQLIGQKALKALETVAAEYGLTVEKMGGKYDEMTFTPKFKFVATSADGVSAAKITWDQFCHVFGLAPEDFGKNICPDNEEFTIAGLEINRSKRPIHVVRVRDGKKFVISSEQAFRYLGHKREAS